MCADGVFSLPNIIISYLPSVWNGHQPPGPDASFYSELQIEPSATTAEIQRAFRKRSRDLHPDKNRGVPHAQERYARLVVISTVLKDSEKRDRYNVSTSAA